MTPEQISQMIRLWAALSAGIGYTNLLGASIINIVYGRKDPEKDKRITGLYLAACANLLFSISLSLMTGSL